MVCFSHITRFPVDAALHLPLWPLLPGSPAQLRLPQSQLGQADLQRWQLVLVPTGSTVAPAADETTHLAERTCVLRHRRNGRWEWDLRIFKGGDDPQLKTPSDTVQ